MHRLVLTAYLTLVLAVVGQAVHAHKQASGKPDNQQVRELAHEITKFDIEMAKEDRSEHASNDNSADDVEETK